MKSEVISIVNNICEEHLKDVNYKIEFTNRGDYVGKCLKKCSNPYYTLRFSEYYFNYFYDNNKLEDIKDTVLHEIAHALAHVKYGKGQHHNRNWKAIAKQIGCSANVRCSIGMYKYKYVYECPVCHNKFYKLRKLDKNKKYFCNKCFDEQQPINLVEEYKTVQIRKLLDK